MGLCFTKPILLDGSDIPYVNWGSIERDWIESGNIIDAKMFVDNIQEILNTVNGNLHGSNLRPGPLTRILESEIQFPEQWNHLYQNNTTHVVGNSHSHDGRDSALLSTTNLGIQIGSTKYRSFGSWMFPSAPHTYTYAASELILFGSAFIESVPAAALDMTILLEVPYDREKYGNYREGITLYSDAGLFGRPIVQFRFTSSVLKGTLKPPVVHPVVSYSGFPYIEVLIGFNRTWTGFPGMWVDWIMPMITNVIVG